MVQPTPPLADPPEQGPHEVRLDTKPSLVHYALMGITLLFCDVGQVLFVGPEEEEGEEDDEIREEEEE